MACSFMVAARLLGPQDLCGSASNFYNLKIITGLSGDEENLFEIQKDCTDEQPNNGETLYALPFVGGYTGSSRSHENSQGTWYNVAIRGLIVRSSGPMRGYYRRLGYFDFTGTEFRPDASKSGDGPPPESSEEGDYYAFLEIMTRIGEATAKAACAEIVANTEHPEERYIIHLV